jgi:hypothetical protein
MVLPIPEGPKMAKFGYLEYAILLKSALISSFLLAIGKPLASNPSTSAIYVLGSGNTRFPILVTSIISPLNRKEMRAYILILLFGF